MIKRIKEQIPIIEIVNQIGIVARVSADVVPAQLHPIVLQHSVEFNISQSPVKVVFYLSIHHLENNLYELISQISLLF